MHLECSTESEAHTLSFHTVLSGNTEETMKHIGVTGAKHKWSTGVIAMRSFLRTICYCGSAEKALPPNPHHLCRFMDNVVLTYLKVQNIFSYLLIQCILTSPSSKDCKKKTFVSCTLFLQEEHLVMCSTARRPYAVDCCTAVQDRKSVV